MEHRRSRAEWEYLVGRWRNGKRTTADFARYHGVNEETLKWWIREFRRQENSAADEAMVPAALPLVEVIEVTPEAKPAPVESGGKVRMAIGTDVVVVFDVAPSAEYLASLVRGVEGRAR